MVRRIVLAIRGTAVHKIVTRVFPHEVAARGGAETGRDLWADSRAFALPVYIAQSVHCRNSQFNAKQVLYESLSGASFLCASCSALSAVRCLGHRQGSANK